MPKMLLLSSCNGGADVGPTQDGCVEGFLQSPDLVEGSESGRVHQAGLYCGVVGSGRRVPRGVALMGFLDQEKCKIAYSLCLV